MEFLRHSRRRTLLSEIVYVALNIALAIAVLLVVLAIESPLPALVLVLLSKWRIFAVRPHYWTANLLANLVDIIVSISFVVLLHAATGALSAQIFLTLLYVGWLVLLKPRSERSLVELQAGVGVLFGVSALMQVSYGWIASFVVLGMWVIGYASARHVLGAYKEAHITLLSLVWGLIMAEIGWLVYHWTFAYDLVIAGDIKLSQAAIFATLISFVAERAYASYRRHEGAIRLSDLILPLLLTLSVIILLSTIFGSIRGVL